MAFNLGYDITECQQAEELLRISEEKHRTLFELASDAILIVSPHPGTILDGNATAEQMLGYTREELLGLSGAEDIAPESVEETILEWVQQFEEKGSFLVETLWLQKVMGYEVESVSDGAAALQAYQAAVESEKPFDLVIMDLTIPGGMGGRKAVGKLHEIDPQARVLVSSGYAHDPVMAHYEEYGFAGKITKPVAMQELGETVKRVLALEE